MSKASHSPRPLSIQTLESRALMAAYTVTSTADTGPGSLREGLEQASADPTISSIIFKPRLGQITLESPLLYEGPQRLQIDGRGATIGSDVDIGQGLENSQENRPTDPFDLLVSRGGASLTLQRLSFTGGARAIYVPVPEDASEAIQITLRQVTVRDAALAGLLIDDRLDSLDDGDGLAEGNDNSQGSVSDGADSDASIAVTLDRAHFNDIGSEELSSDGVRVEEGGIGDVSIRMIRSTISGATGHGARIEESGDGSVRVQAIRAVFAQNGDSANDDAGDGLHVAESGSGDLWAGFVDVAWTGNQDDGIEIAESDLGDARVQFAKSRATGNGGTGLSIHEYDAGRLWVSNVQGFIADNGEDGVLIDEAGDGQLTVSMKRPRSMNNQGHGVNLKQADPGSEAAIANLRHPKLNGNRKGEVDALGIKVNVT